MAFICIRGVPSPIIQFYQTWLRLGQPCCSVLLLMQFSSRVRHLLIPLLILHLSFFLPLSSKCFHSPNLNFNILCFWKADFPFFNRISLTSPALTLPTSTMSSAELIAEILALSSGLDSFNQFQILSLSQSNSLFSFAPELITFSQFCGNELQQLLELSQSSIFNSLIATNINLAGSLSPCLEQLLGLEQLFAFGVDNLQLGSDGNVDNNLNGTDVSNSTAGVDSASNSTASAANVTEDALPPNTGSQNSKGKEKKKNGKRGEVVQRSGANKRQVLGGFGLGLMVVVGAFAL